MSATMSPDVAIAAVRRIFSSPPQNSAFYVADAGDAFASLEGDALDEAWALGLPRLHTDIRVVRSFAARGKDPKVTEALRAARAEPDADPIAAAQLDVALWARGDEEAGDRTIATLAATQSAATVRAIVFGLRHVKSAKAVAIADAHLDHRDAAIRATAFESLFRILGVEPRELPTGSFSDALRDIMSPFPTALADTQTTLRQIFAGRTPL